MTIERLGWRAIIRAYGACLEISAADQDLLARLTYDLPRGWKLTTNSETCDWRFEARRQQGRVVTVNGAGVEAGWSNIAGAQGALREELRRFVGYHTPDLLFVHAGVVAYREAAIVLPGLSFAGKSTLVEALVRAGADFYSDEYAIFDQRGRVIQYREPLIVRSAIGREETEIVADGPDRPLPVSLLVLTSYRDGVSWEPRQASVAEAIVATIEHVSGARRRPGETISTLKLALRNASVLVGERGDAEQTAAALLDFADQIVS